MNLKFSFSLEKLLFWLFAGLVLILPIIFVPTFALPLLVVKYSVLLLFVAAIVSVWLLMRLRDGVCLLPINMLSLAGVFVLLTLFVSSIFSGHVWDSLLGQLPQTDTFIFYLCVFVLFLIAPNILNSAKRIFGLYKVFFVAVAIVAAFVILRLFVGAGFLSFGYFSGITDNLLGKWNDLGIFFGLSAVLSFVALELLSLNKILKISTYISLFVSLALLAVINFISIWYVLCALAIVFFVYSVVISRSTGTKKATQITLPFMSLAVFVIALVFIIGGARIGSSISSYFKISNSEFSLSGQVTAGIAKGTLTQHSIRQTIIGVGPNRFVNEWLLFKPEGVNSSIFWNTDFNSGVGIIPSALVTTGILGFIAWLAFFGVLVYMGFRSILSRIADPLQRFVVISSFLASLYLWIFSLVYVPGLVIIVLTFIFTGVFASSLYEAGILKFVRLEYFKNPKVGFISVLSFVIIFILGLGLLYGIVSKLIAASYYNQGLREANNSNLDLGQQKIESAISFDLNDNYVRSLAQIYLLRLNSLLTQQNASSSAEVLKNQFSNISNRALSASQVAISLDDSNYQNWLMSGDVWSALVPLKIEKAYQNATNAYQKALDLNPKSPYIYLQIAKLESAQGNAVAAKEEASKALSAKKDYTDAYLFLAELQVSEGDIKSAIQSVENATLATPNNSNLYFQLGLLRYQVKDYQNAIGAFEQAVLLDNYYSNAKYFLGLSYFQVGRIKDATAQFVDLKKLNPNNTEIQNVLQNLEDGKSPLGKVVSTTSTATSTKQKVK